ncbi:hypothetical protein ACQ4LE_001976 [Meloidogyne hapla]|uniref:Cytochrome c oxidase subunit n=1 Tax=Meloidogyne hapla TaxID=6305 RepID=A0A1I8BKM0_MELHA
MPITFEGFEIPDTFRERVEKQKASGGPVMLHPDDPRIWTKEYHEKSKNEFAWAAPYDSRFPQQRKQRHCFTYYVDFFRCKELMGDDYAPCKFFQNVYRDICPGYWVEKWDDQRESGTFPADFDR